MTTRAKVALEQGRAAEALEAATVAHDLLMRLQGIEEGDSLVRLVHAEALRASGDLEQARVHIAIARDRLLATAANVGDPELRKSFPERIPENARTVALAREWGA